MTANLPEIDTNDYHSVFEKDVGRGTRTLLVTTSFLFYISEIIHNPNTF